MSTKLSRQLDISVKSINIEERIIEAVASDESVDRMGDVIIAAGWMLDNYKKNPVITFCHDYHVLPVAKTIEVWIEGNQLKFKAQFPKPGELGESEHAKLVETVWQMFQNGLLNAFSVGFMPKEMMPRMSDNGTPTQGMTITKSELLEIAVVVVPANANALAVRMKELFKIKNAIPYKETAKADKNEKWDGSAEVAAANIDDLKIMCAWVDNENPDIKQAYKLPHHKADGHAVVWRGVAAAMAALLGARGGVDIPDADKKAVYDHLAKHYKEFDEEPPEFKSIESVAKSIIETNQKAGRVLSGKNIELINTAILAMQAAINSLEELLTSAQNNADQQNGKQIFNAIGKVINDILTRKEGDG